LCCNVKKKRGEKEREKKREGDEERKERREKDCGAN